jgi:hypothetical protein
VSLTVATFVHLFLYVHLNMAVYIVTNKPTLCLGRSILGLVLGLVPSFLLGVSVRPSSFCFYPLHAGLTSFPNGQLCVECVPR